MWPNPQENYWETSFFVQCVEVLSLKATSQHLNQFHNILRLSDVLPNFLLTTSETMVDYYLQTWYIQAVSWVAERPRKLGNSKLHRMIAQPPVSPTKWKLCQYYNKTLEEQKPNPPTPHCAPSHTKTRASPKYSVSHCRRHSFSSTHKSLAKNNISYPMIYTRTCAHQGVTNVSPSENFAYVLNE